TISMWNNALLDDKSTDLIAQIRKANEILESSITMPSHFEEIYSDRLFNPLCVTDLGENDSKSLLIMDPYLIPQVDIIDVEKDKH
ncbi:8333_t:CDS:2, partial [Scutellospora calospora]